MPRSAIATGLIDDILPVEDIPQRIADYIHGVPVKPAAPVPRPATAQMPGNEVLARILRLLQQAGGRLSGLVRVRTRGRGRASPGDRS